MNTSIGYETVEQVLRIVIPEIILLLAGIAMMTASPMVRIPRSRFAALAAGALLAALFALLALAGELQTDIYAAVVLQDALSFYGRLVVVLGGLVLLGLAHEEPPEDRGGEFFGALLVIHAGAMLVIGSNELVLLFVGLELVSIPTYLLLYLSRRTAATQESATKYFYLSIFSSALLLYGLAFLYGLTGISNLKALAAVSVGLPRVPDPMLGLVAVVFVMAGLSFRVAAVPFHFYAPDVYQGSPTVLAALLSWVPKAVGFGAMIRLLIAVISMKGADDPLVQKAITVSWVIAAATMTLGNTVALVQSDLKRLLAYSSIAHAGYLMIGVAAAFANGPRPASFYSGIEGILVYLVAYALMTLGAFGVILALKIGDRPVETVDDLAGLGSTQPMPALALAICLLSLSGIPPLAGFWGKFQIFAAALSARPSEENASFLVLAVLGVLNAAVAAYYYLRIIVVMYLRPQRQQVAAGGGWPVALAVGSCVGLTLLLSNPNPVARAAREAAETAVRPSSPAVPPVAVVTPASPVEVAQSRD
jgi:NADH-quinone oxidoreductase subunit N